MGLCLFSSALPGWNAARVARAALEAGLTALEWGIGPGQAVESPRDAATALKGLGVAAGGVCVQGGAASLTAPMRLSPFAALAAELGVPHVRREQGAWRWRHAPLDSGLLDWDAILAALRHAGHAGRLCIDHLGGRPSLATLQRELSALRSG